MKSFKTPNIQDVFLIFFVVYSFQTIEAKSAFQRETPPPKETHNDVFIHPPPRENDVPLAFKKGDTVVASNVDGHLHISLPLQPMIDIIKKAKEHYELGKKRKPIGLETYHPCGNECKNEKDGVYRCITQNYYRTKQICQLYEHSDAMKLEKANLDDLEVLWNVLQVLMSDNPAHISERSFTAIVSIISLIGTGISSLVTALNANQIHHLNQQATIHTQNDIIVSKSLRTIYTFENETLNNMEKIQEATTSLILAETKQERRMQLFEIDMHRWAHVQTNNKLISNGIKVITEILEKAMHGKLSSQITLIHDIEQSLANFQNKAREHGYKVPASAHSHLFQLDTSFYVDKEAQTINLLVHIPLLRDDKPLVMYEYVGTAIPINSQHGIILQNEEDIIAYNDEGYATLKSDDLWKCQKIATVHFCRDIISSVKPISQMKDTCFGALKAGKYDELMDKCHDTLRITNLKDELKRISKNTFVIYSKEPSSVTFPCLTKKPPQKLEVHEKPIKGFMKVTIGQNCMVNFNGEKKYAQTEFESDNNVANYWLPIKNDFLKSFPIAGLNEEKLLKSMEKLGNSSKSLHIGDLIKNADEIDHNIKIADQLSDLQFHNIILYAIVAFLSIMQVVLGCLTKKKNAREMKC